MVDVLQVQNLSSVRQRFSLEGKKAFVTGAAGGIGRSSAAAFAELGADVAIVDLEAKREKGEEVAEYLAKKFGVKTMFAAADVSDETSVSDMINQIVKEFGTITTVHSNAGIISIQDSPDMSLEEWNKIMNVNLTGMFLVNRASAKVMVESGQGGTIVNTASMSGTIVNQVPPEARHAAAYCTSKAAVKHLSKVMAVDYASKNIRVNSISPGVMMSGIHDNFVPLIGGYDNFNNTAKLTEPIGRFGDMNEIGGVVAFLSSDLASYITGVDLLVDGGHTVW